MDTFLTSANQFLNFINGFLWGWPMIILLIGTHLYLTIRLHFPQRHIIKAIKLSISKDKGSDGDVSQFSALATGLAATIGTGNIIGVATAVVHGGPGAVFWCWITGLFGIATKYSEALLAVKYRIKDNHGNMHGGPMYAIERGMKQRWLALAFSAFAFVASFGIGCLVQSNAISITAADTFGIPTYVTGLVLAALVAAVIFFGVKGISRVCVALVPFMAAFYIIGCIILLVVNGPYIWPAIKCIVTEAFSTEAVEGGALGSAIMLAMRYGIARGLFSNEAGLGSAPIVAAAARTKNPVRQALVSSTSVFWDTIIICALTGIVLVSTILAPNGIDASAGEALTKRAFAQIPLSIAGMPLGDIILSIAIFTFAFSTTLGWAYYGEKSIEYLSGKHYRTARYIYRVLITICTFCGANWAIELVWNFSDTANALMAIPNLICLMALSGVLVKETRHYLWENRLDEEMKEE